MKSDSRLEILVVEDSTIQANHLKHLLKDHDFAVTITRNGKEALEYLHEHKPAVVISDITMPELDGYELCRRIRSNERMAELPIILLTSLSDPEDVFKGLECGADNFITKPYDQTHLLARIRYLLANAHLRQREKVQTSMEIFLAGRKHVITSDRAQILNLLLSTYEAAVQKNRELAKARDDLTRLNEELERKVLERTMSLAEENTERKRAEAEVRDLNVQLEQRVRDRTAELEASNKELEAFSYSVSHDLRSPLRAIDTFSNDLRKDYASLIPAEAQELLDMVVSNAARMGNLIDDLLRLSRLGRQRLTKQKVSLSDLVQATLDELRAQNPNRKIEVRMGNLPDCVGDPSLLKQVLVNLLSNCYKFTRDKTDAWIEIGCQSQNGENVYYIRDNGAGFDMQYAGKLFGVFERLHGGNQFEGTGVGLSIVQRIIHRHGGRVWAKGEVNKGAIFYFALPN